MDVTVAESGPCRKTIKISIPAEQVKAHLDQVFQDAARQVEIKGFRRGKVPRRVLEQKFGGEIRTEAKESLINRSFEEAVRGQSLSPIGRPSLEGIDESPLDETAGLQFQVHVDVKPQFELGAVKGIEIRRGETEVTDDDINAALRQLANEKRTLKPVSEPVADGDFVKMDLVFKDDQGEVVLERKGSQLNTNIPIAGADPEAFAARLRGAETGQRLELELEFPETFEKAEVRGRKGAVEMTVGSVLRVVPAPVDDALAKAYDFEKLDDLVADLRRRLGQEKTRLNERRCEEELINILINENPFELPQSMVDDQVQHGLREFEERMKQAEVGEEEIRQRVEAAKPEARQDAERRVRVFFLLEAVARKEKIFVTEGDIEVELRNIAAQNAVSLGEVREYYEKHRLLADLRLGLLERKVRDFLRQHAKLTD